MKKITVIGGGTGTFVSLTGLKTYPVDLGVVVSMMDSGGSTGRLRDQLGVLPPGDLRQCLVALSEAPDLWRKLFLYRFEKGDLEGHNFGNILLSTLEKVSGDYEEVIRTASFVLRTKGVVLPVTVSKTHLCAEYENGTIVEGEGNIDENTTETARIKRAFLCPEVQATDSALKRIRESQMLVIGPGDLYTSLIPVLLAGGVREALRGSRARIVYVMNLMTKAGQTRGYTASDHIRDLEKYMGKQVDAVIMHKGPIPDEAIAWYAKHNEHLVEDDLPLGKKIVRVNVVDTEQKQKSDADVLTRSILRHDSVELARVLMKHL